MRVASALQSRGEFYMSRINPKRKRRSKAVPVLGAAGLSLTLASEGSLAIAAPPLDTMTRNVIHEIALQEEEACDVTLAPRLRQRRSKSVPGRRSTHHPWPGLLPVRVFGWASSIPEQCLFAPGTASD